jgi:curli biogenesis system outer membrane secretion channel CsgG
MAHDPLADFGRRFPRQGRRRSLRFLLVLLALLAALAAAGCATTAGLRPGIASRLPPYDGPKARIAVSRFDVKAAKAAGEVGTGLADMLTTELVNSNRFIVLERENLSEVLSEQDLGTQGRVAAPTRAPTGEVLGAEILVMGAVTAFEPNKMGLGSLLMGGATLVGSALISAKNDWFPVGAATYRESYLALDLRLVDAATSRVLASLSVEGSATDVGGGLIGSVGGGRTAVPLFFGGWQGTSAEEAMRVAILQAVEEIAARVPGEYLRHRPDAPREGELLGYTVVELAPMPAFASPRREARVYESVESLRTSVEAWGGTLPPGLPYNPGREFFLAVVGGPADRGSLIGIQKVINHRDAVRVEVGVMPLPPGVTPPEKPAIPVVVLRLSSVGKPASVFWQEAGAAERQP